MISSAASHISSEIALWRSGLLKIIQPTPSSFFAIILSLGIAVLLRRFRWLLQPLDLGVVVAELAQHLGGVLALRGRCGDDVARRAAQRHRLAEVGDVADLLHDAEVLHLRIGERLVDRVDRPARARRPRSAVSTQSAVSRVGEVLLELGVQRVAVLASAAPPVA